MEHTHPMAVHTHCIFQVNYSKLFRQGQNFRNFRWLKTKAHDFERLSFTRHRACAGTVPCCLWIWGIWCVSSTFCRSGASFAVCAVFRLFFIVDEWSGTSQEVALKCENIFCWESHLLVLQLFFRGKLSPNWLKSTCIQTSVFPCFSLFAVKIRASKRANLCGQVCIPSHTLFGWPGESHLWRDSRGRLGIVSCKLLGTSWHMNIWSGCSTKKSLILFWLLLTFYFFWCLHSEMLRVVGL